MRPGRFALSGKTTDEAADAIIRVSGDLAGRSGGRATAGLEHALLGLGMRGAAILRYGAAGPELWEWACQAGDGRWLVAVEKQEPDRDHVVAVAKRRTAIAIMDRRFDTPAKAVTTAEGARRRSVRTDGACRVHRAWPIVEAGIEIGRRQPSR